MEIKIGNGQKYTWELGKKPPNYLLGLDVKYRLTLENYGFSEEEPCDRSRKPEWHKINDAKIKESFEAKWQITEISASPEETQKILNKLGNIPYNKKGFTIWHGDMARFVYSNLL